MSRWPWLLRTAARTADPSKVVLVSPMAGGGSATKISRGPSGGRGEDPGAEPPTARAAPAATWANDRLGGYALIVLGRAVEWSTTTTGTAVGESDADPHHAHRSAVHSGLDVNRIVGIQENRHIYPESIGVHVQLGNRNDGVLGLAEHRVDRQRRGKCAFRGTIPGGRRPTAFCRLSGWRQRLEEGHRTKGYAPLDGRRSLRRWSG